jgi:hypothetical protein
MDGPQVIGLATIGLAMLVVCWLLLRRRPALFLVALAVCAVGLGYLATTPHPTVIARTLFGEPY